jgi:hypothetical protein
MGAVYNEKICCACGSTFLPTSPKQKSCGSKECRAVVRRKAERNRYSVLLTKLDRKCTICNISFITTDTRQIYCGSMECIKEGRRRKQGGKEKTPRHDSKRFDFEKVKTIFEEAGYRLEQTCYVNNSVPIKCVCPEGHHVALSLANMKVGKRCVHCFHQKQKMTIEEVSSIFAESGYKVLQDYYEISYAPIKCMCPEGHETTLTWNKFQIGRRCKVCSTNAKKYTFSSVKEIFESEGYTLLQDFYVNAKVPIKCRCPKGHEIQIRPSGFMLDRHSRCGVCSIDERRIPIGDVKAYFEKEGCVVKQDFYLNARCPIKYICPKGHEAQTSWDNFYNKGKRCGICSTPFSRAEKEICSYVKSIHTGEVYENSRQIIPPYELDIFIPAKKIAIEYCGLYWHSEVEGEKARSYHYDKMMACAGQGIRLITVFEDEYINRPEVVKSRIMNAIGLCPRRFFARKCEVKEISKEVSSKFLLGNHLQGNSNSIIGFGLFSGEELLQVFTMGYVARHHTSVDGKYLELKRFASFPGVSVVGGASKLFSVAKKYAIEEGFTHIKSYCDMRYANITKPVYEDLGFVLQTFTKYTPHYIKEGIRYRNQGLRKTPEERITGKTEWELRREQGYDRIWDCGHRTYVYKL